jgi:RNA polymerase sigma factor (sigma-70 family)
MVETRKGEQGGDLLPSGATMTAPELKTWFVREVLSLEPILMRFLSQNWRNRHDIEDMRQDIYSRVLEAASHQLPEKAKPFVLATARNYLIDRVLRERIVPIDTVADLDTLSVATDVPGPDRNAIGRDELRKLRSALERLPPRCCEAVILRRVEGLSRREIATRMGVTENTVADHIRRGMNALADEFFGAAAELRKDA